MTTASMTKPETRGSTTKLQSAATRIAAPAPFRKPIPAAMAFGRVAKSAQTTATITTIDPPDGQAVAIHTAAAASIATAARSALRSAASGSTW